MTRTLEISETLSVVECCNCHMTFAVTQRFEQSRRADHVNFYCPAGHPQHWAQQSSEEKLRTELATVKRRLEWKESARLAAVDQATSAERRRRAAVGQNTKMRKRIANGVCPCCNRSFADLHRHMSSQHPTYVADAVK